MNYNIALVLVLLSFLSRLISHPPNFTPILAIAIFCGITFERKFASYLIPLLGVILSNIVLGFQPISFVVLGILLGLSWLARSRRVDTSRYSWVFYSVFAAIIFFIVSNFFVWLGGNLYDKTFEGLCICYWMAIPFFKHTLISTVFYSFFLFEGQNILVKLISRRVIS